MRYKHKIGAHVIAAGDLVSDGGTIPAGSEVVVCDHFKGYRVKWGPGG